VNARSIHRCNTLLSRPIAHVRRRRSGFTLVEILIVVVILGILASIVVPQFSNASQTARQNTLREDLQYLRTQVNVYEAQHVDVAAGYPGGVSTATPDAADFINQMTLFTDQLGNTSSTGSAVFQFGPYLSQMPTNPVNGMTTVLVVANGAAIPTADGSTGWIYKPQTLEIYANNTGNDINGVPFSSY
jgi:general secretion pathway protein G